MIANYSKNFIKQLKKAPQKIKTQLIKRIEIFSQNPLHPHPLQPMARCLLF